MSRTSAQLWHGRLAHACTVGAQGLHARRIVRLALAAVTVAAAASFAGCGPERRDTPYTEPLANPTPDVAAGERVYAAHCYQCHPGGAGGLGPAINDKPLPVAAIKTQVRNGLGVMPAFDEKEISDADLENVVRYLKALRTLKPVKNDATARN